MFIIWKGAKEQLITLVVELNKKHKTIKFEYEISSQKIPFLNTMVYKDKENNLQIATSNLIFRLSQNVLVH